MLSVKMSRLKWVPWGKLPALTCSTNGSGVQAAGRCTGPACERGVGLAYGTYELETGYGAGASVCDLPPFRRRARRPRLCKFRARLVRPREMEVFASPQSWSNGRGGGRRLTNSGTPARHADCELMP
jgi:hypothetical protein